jgi:hypothetical protein
MCALGKPARKVSIDLVPFRSMVCSDNEQIGSRATRGLRIDFMKLPNQWKARISTWMATLIVAGSWGDALAGDVQSYAVYKGRGFL